MYKIVLQRVVSKTQLSHNKCHPNCVSNIDHGRAQEIIVPNQTEIAITNFNARFAINKDLSKLTPTNRKPLPFYFAARRCKRTPAIIQRCGRRKTTRIECGTKVLHHNELTRARRTVCKTMTPTNREKQPLQRNKTTRMQNWNAKSQTHGNEIGDKHNNIGVRPNP